MPDALEAHRAPQELGMTPHAWETRGRRSRRAVLGLAVATLTLATTPARAVDGCLVMLCFAAPSWRAVPQCVPPIRQVLRDLARGKGLPTCAMAGAGTAARHAWASAPGYCPPQYVRTLEWESGSYQRCDYDGAVSVAIDGALFARTWWSLGGDTVTEFTPAAKARLGSWDRRFDDEHARWLALQPQEAAVDGGP